MTMQINYEPTRRQLMDEMAEVKAENAALRKTFEALPELVEAAKTLLTHSAFDVDPQDCDEEDRAKERALRVALAKMEGK